jgi:PAS domain S-box-containing protein
MAQASTDHFSDSSTASLKKFQSIALLRDESKLVDRLIVAAGSFAVYVIIFLILHSLLGVSFTALVLIPILAAAWLFGPAAGAATAALGWSLGMLFQWNAGGLALHSVSLIDSILSFPIFLALGLLTGVVSNQDKRIKRDNKERIEAKKEHHEAVALLKTTIDANNEGIAIANLAGDILHCNPQFLELWKITSSSWKDINFLNNTYLFSLLEDSNTYVSHIQYVFDNPHLKTTFEIGLEDGRVFSCETKPRRLEGETCGVTFIFLDITDWKQTKDALTNSEQNLRWLINHSTEGILLLNEHGNILEWNEAMERMSGLKWEEVFHRAMADVAFYMLPPNQRNPEVLANSRSIWKEMLQTGQNRLEPDHQQTILRRSDGKRSVVEVSVLPVQTAIGFMMGVFYRDISDRKRVEESLREQIKIVRSILNAYPDRAALIDISGRVLAANQALIEAASEYDQAVVNDAIEDLLPPALRGEVLLLMEKVALEGKPYYADSQSAEQYYHLTVYPLSMEYGKVKRLVLFIRNITESRQRERELEAIASITSALRAALTRAEVYPIILDQVETLLNADGIGLIVRDRNTREVSVEQARGAWTSLLNKRYSSDQATRGPIMIMEEPYLNNNIEKDQHLFQTKPFFGLQATACVPLVIDSEIIGSLWIGCKNKITKEDVRILSALAHITASAIHRAVLYENTRLYAEQVYNAAEVGRTLTETMQLDEMYDRLAHALLKMLPNLCTVMISRYNLKKNTFTYEYALHDEKPVDKDEIPYLQRYQPGDSALKEIVRTRTPLVINDLKSRGSTRMITLELNARSGLFAPLVSKGEILGILQVHSYLKHRFTPSDVEMFALIGNTAAIAFQNANLFEDLQKSHDELAEAYEATLDGWAQALDLRDSGTHGHTRRVVELTVRLGRFMGFHGDDLVQLRRGALLHDIGKMGVPDHILRKTGPLTNEEWTEMRNHTSNAYQWLSPIPFLKAALDIPYCHHEKWDGSGYPRGLVGERIPLAARIFAVIDVWDALLSDRPYRPAWPVEKVNEYLREQRGVHFDPRVVDAFFHMENEYK